MRETPRPETILYTSFTSDTMSKEVTLAKADMKKIRSRLRDRKIATADFAPQTEEYTWFRIVVYSCFNANSMDIPDPRYPPGFALGQLELIGVSGAKGRAGGASSRTRRSAPAVLSSSTTAGGDTVNSPVPDARTTVIALEVAIGAGTTIRSTPGEGDARGKRKSAVRR